MKPTFTTRLRFGLMAGVCAAALVACSSGGSTEQSGGLAEQSGGLAEQSGGQDGSAASDTRTEPQGENTVTLITHDSFAVAPDVLAAFEKSSGIKVVILAQGDAGEMLSKLIVTKGNPLGDVVFGIDNTFATKALDAGILAPYTSPLASKGADKYALDSDSRLTAVDFGDVCVNVDHGYFKEHGLAEPKTFEDLAKPAYKNLLVAEDAATSSPGLAFLLGTVAHFGADGWQAYWTSLMDNGLKITSGWTDAYTVDFSGSSGHGDRPLVVSYASSPPSEVQDGVAAAPTGALLDTCFRQVEYAGVLEGTGNADAAGQVVDFLLSADFQAGLPEQMWMYPVDRDVPLPDDWATYAPVASDPATLDPAEIDANRQQWIDDFTDIVHP